MDNESLIALLKDKAVLADPRIEDALRGVDRIDFVTDEHRLDAYRDTALPIGYGQTISQPYTVVFMLELLHITEGNRVLDVGYGSGWLTSLIAHIVGEEGRVIAIELIPELCAFGEDNIAKYPTLKARTELECHDASSGPLARSPQSFDRIIASAEVQSVPDSWRKMLRFGGRMVYPQNGSIICEIKDRSGGFSKREFPGFAFVPFVSGSEHPY